MFAAGDYMWISFHDMAAIKLEEPSNCATCCGLPPDLTTGPTFRSRELGEILLPAISPLSWQHDEDEVRLGRVSEWCEDENGEVAPYGRKNLLVDGEEFPVLEIRELEIIPRCCPSSNLILMPDIEPILQPISDGETVRRRSESTRPFR